MDASMLVKTAASENDLGRIALTLSAFRRGDALARLPDDWEGTSGEVAAEFNLLSAQCGRIWVQLRGVASDLSVHAPGATARSLSVEALDGFWLDPAANVNAIMQRDEPATEWEKIVLLSLSALKDGETPGLPPDWSGVHGRLAQVFNELVDQNVRMSEELARLSRVTDNVNFMAGNLTSQVRKVAEVTKAVAAGDLSKKITVDVKGEILELKNTINTAAVHVGSARLGEEAQADLASLWESERALHGKKVLIVGDDMRNIFALATVVEDYGMRHVWADNGRDAIRLVATDPAIDAVLMGIMMPEMDGLTTIRELRKLPAGRPLPIVAVTAKSMKGDRERCIAAGAWDYLSKPVDRGDLLAVLNAWLHA